MDEHKEAVRAMQDYISDHINDNDRNDLRHEDMRQFLMPVLEAFRQMKQNNRKRGVNKHQDIFTSAIEGGEKA